jgi:hypothetical protein
LEELAGMLADGSLKPATPVTPLSGIEEVPSALVGQSGTLGLGHSAGKTVVVLQSSTMERDTK